MRPLLAPPLLAVLAFVLAACSGGNSASNLANAPTFDPKGQAKCGVTKSQAKPLIVEWPSADRGELETRARQGLVAVRYEGCEMEVLGRCKVPGSYVYAGMTRKDDKITMRDSDDLYASIPVYAAKFEAKLQKSGELNVAMTMVGRYAADRANVGADELQGDCSKATHIVSALTVGAFTFTAGADAIVGGGATVMGAGTGASSTSKRETLNADGDATACEKSTPEDKTPPPNCGAMLRVEVVPVRAASQAAAAVPAATAPPTPTCPVGSTWNGSACAAVEVACPVGASWDGAKCAATMNTACPSGTQYVASLGCVPNAPAAPSRSVDPGPTTKSGGLIWQTIDDGTYNFEGATRYCATLAGGNWRLPSVDEIRAVGAAFEGAGARASALPLHSAICQAQQGGVWAAGSYMVSLSASPGLSLGPSLGICGGIKGSAAYVAHTNGVIDLVCVRAP